MLQTLIQWLTQYIAIGLDWLVELFLSCLDTSLDSYIEAFPLFADAYSLFQVIGSGLTVVLACLSFYSFFFFKASDLKVAERPIDILFHSALAFMAIYYGGYVLSYIVHVASWSFGAFMNLGAAESAETEGLITQITSADTIAETVAGKIGEALLKQSMDIGASVLSLLLTIVIGWNLVKLIIEVCERWLMVGVLFYTAPLACCTIASKNTGNLFRNWCRMFFGSLLMMSLSAFFLKLIVNGLFTIRIGDDYWTQMLFILALTKISQRTDSYLAQLGLGVPITGGNMIDDIAAAGAAIKGMLSGGGKGSKNGSVSGKGDSRYGGLLGSSINAIRAAKGSYASGFSAKQSLKAAGSSFINTLKRTTPGGAINGGITAAKAAAANGLTGAKKVSAVAAGAAAGAAVGTAKRYAQGFAPGTMNAHKASLEHKAAVDSAFAGNMKAQENTNFRKAHTNAVAEVGARAARSGNAPLPIDWAASTKHDNFSVSAKQAAINRSRYGVAPEGASAMVMDHANHQIALQPHAMLAGASLDSIAVDGRTQHTLGGDDYTKARVLESETGSFGKGPFTTAADVPPTNFFRGAAIRSLDRTDDTFRKDRETMPADAFNAKYNAVIQQTAESLRAMDLKAVESNNRDYTETISNTMAYASPNVGASLFFDSSKDLDNDAILAPMFSKTFQELNPSGENVQYHDVSVTHLPDATYKDDGTLTPGGTMVTATYKDDAGKDTMVQILDSVAYTSPALEDNRDSYQELVLSDGRSVYVSSNMPLASNYEERVASSDGSLKASTSKAQPERIDEAKVREQSERQVGRN